MELITLAALAWIGFGLISIATLALLVLHAFENRLPAWPESLTSHKHFAPGRFRLHQFPRVKHAEASRQSEEPTQRAA